MLNFVFGCSYNDFQVRLEIIEGKGTTHIITVYLGAISVDLKPLSTIIGQSTSFYTVCPNRIVASRLSIDNGYILALMGEMHLLAEISRFCTAYRKNYQHVFNK